MSQLSVLFVGAFVTGQLDQPRLDAPVSCSWSERCMDHEKYQNIQISKYQKDMRVTVLL
jgi:hypothetical protein